MIVLNKSFTNSVYSNDILPPQIISNVNSDILKAFQKSSTYNREYDDLILNKITTVCSMSNESHSVLLGRLNEELFHYRSGLDKALALNLKGVENLCLDLKGDVSMQINSLYYYSMGTAVIAAAAVIALIFFKESSTPDVDKSMTAYTSVTAQKLDVLLENQQILMSNQEILDKQLSLFKKIGISSLSIQALSVIKKLF